MFENDKKKTSFHIVPSQKYDVFFLLLKTELLNNKLSVRDR